LAGKSDRFQYFGGKIFFVCFDTKKTWELKNPDKCCQKTCSSILCQGYKKPTHHWSEAPKVVDSMLPMAGSSKYAKVIHTWT
jgi:hypothetical protein